MIECQKAEFFFEDGEHYLNCAYMSPTTRKIERAAIAALDLMRRPSRITTEMFFDVADAVRAEFAYIIGARDARQVAIIPSVSYGIATVARNAIVERGQRIVVVQDQFPSNVYSWRRLADDCGAAIMTVHYQPGLPATGAGLNQKLLGSIDERTAVVAVPQAHWTDGTRIDIDEVAKRARDVGALFVIDGSQSVGAVPIDVSRTRPDALICAGYKWLFGPYGLCLGYFGESLLGGIPLEENWLAREGSENFAELVHYRDTYQPGAIRYDVGERSNFLLLPMMLAGLRQVREWQPQQVQDYCRRLVEPAVDTLVDLGLQAAPSGDRFSHIVGVRIPDNVDRQRLAAALAARRINVSFRGSAIRVSPHVYNDSHDVDALVDVLQSEVRH